MEPEDLEGKEFLISLRGYDRDEVDRFVREVADELRQLRSAVGASAQMVQQPPDALAAYRQVGEETSKILVAAEEAGNEIRQRAKREAAEVVAAARSEAAEIARAIDEGRAAAEKDLEALQQARSLLATQLEDVKRRLEETISRLQAPMIDIPPRRTSSLPSTVSPTVVDTARGPRGVDEVPTTRPRGVEEAEREEPSSSAPAAVEEESPARPLTQDRSVQPELSSTEVAEPEAPVGDGNGSGTLEQLLEEIRRERDESKREVDEALASIETPEATAVASDEVGAEESDVFAPPVRTQAGPIQAREDLLGDAPAAAARRLKRLLQEDQNDLLDRIRTTKAKGSFDADISPESSQVDRFRDGLIEMLGGAFTAGRKQGGASEQVDPQDAVRNLVTRQLVAPLRKELGRVIDAGIEAKDTATAVAERASDVYRVWKGVRTELLGEGLVYSAFHQGLLDVWRRQGAATKTWVLDEEDQCPRDLCKQNATAGAVAVDAAFPSGHLAPPAHGGCTCTLTGPESVG